MDPLMLSQLWLGIIYQRLLLVFLVLCTVSLIHCVNLCSTHCSDHLDLWAHNAPPSNFEKISLLTTCFRWWYVSAHSTILFHVSICSPLNEEIIDCDPPLYHFLSCLSLSFLPHSEHTVCVHNFRMVSVCLIASHPTRDYSLRMVSQSLLDVLR